MLAADPTMQRTVKTLLDHRHQALGISRLSSDVRAHPRRDPGCRLASEQVLDPVRQEFRKAIVIFDFHGCGENNLTAVQLENTLQQTFQAAGWGNDEIVFIVIDPELEAWIFGASFGQLESYLEWSQGLPIDEWLREKGHLSPGMRKPSDPQSALDAMLQLQKRKRSSKLFADLARTVGLARCQDRAFQKFRSTLQRWFPAQ